MYFTEAIADALNEDEACTDSAFDEIIRIEKIDCLVHRLRTMRSKIYNCGLSEECVGKPSYLSYAYRMARICDGVVVRFATELKRGLKSEPAGDRYRKIQVACSIIPKCFAADHSECKQKSFVCRGPRKFMPTAHLPYSTPLQMTDADITALNSVIEKYTTTRSLIGLRFGLDTNKVEALHHRTFHHLPKHKTMKRNYAGRNASAMNSDSYGSGGSLVRFNAKKGSRISSKAALQFLKLMDEKARYHRLYRRSKAVRQRRGEARWHQINIKKFKNMSIQ